MRLFVGLGNPGAKYARNRHNIGFMALDRIAENHGFAPWRAKFQGEISEGRFWSFSEIEAELGGCLFTPNFELEYARYREWEERQAC